MLYLGKRGGEVRIYLSHQDKMCDITSYWPVHADPLDSISIHHKSARQRYSTAIMHEEDSPTPLPTLGVLHNDTPEWYRPHQVWHNSQFPCLHNGSISWCPFPCYHNCETRILFLQNMPETIESSPRRLSFDQR